MYCFTENKKGFTLLEALLAIVVISIMVVAISQLMLRSMESYSLISDRREALQRARLAVNMMTNELQTIANPAADITAISATSITFVPAAGGSVTYTISGGNLTRGADTLASGLTANSGFAYYTAGGGVTAIPAQVYRIHLAIEVLCDDTKHGKVMVNSNVYLRNRYYTNFRQL